MFIIDVLGQLGNGFGISIRLEFEALALQESLEFRVVGDDAIVNDCKFPVGIGSVKVKKLTR